jgi:3-isopropylmalate dehydrogenase
MCSKTENNAFRDIAEQENQTTKLDFEGSRASASLPVKHHHLRSIVKNTYEIAVMPGDGIGPEVTDAAMKVLRAGAEACGFALNYTFYDFGAEAYQRTGRFITPADMDVIGKSDAILFGAMGLPDVRTPDGREWGAQVEMRAYYGLFASLRPAKLFEGVPTNIRSSDVDMLVIRETTEGMFAGLKDPQAESDEQMSDRMTITRATSEKLFRVAFEQARGRRRLYGTRGHVTLLDKSNALRSNVLLRKVFLEVAKQYPDIQTDCFYVDAGAMYMVTNPERYDVVVTENIFGDITSEIAAGVVGGLGIAPSADIGDNHGVFQPSHGSAPDIAGKGLANPVAAILAAAMMLEWLAGKHDDHRCAMACVAIRNAVSGSLLNGPRTVDLGGSSDTSTVATAVAQSLALQVPRDAHAAA